MINICKLYYWVNIMADSLSRCSQCGSPITDSIETEIDNHGRVKFGKYVDGSWICNDCMARRTGASASTIQDNANNSVRHEHIGVANKADVSPNTPTAEEE
jgi:hypothetical protein